MVRTLTHYQCETCEKIFTEKDKATRCCAREVSIGDNVRIGEGLFKVLATNNGFFWCKKIFGVPRFATIDDTGERPTVVEDPTCYISWE